MVSYRTLRSVASVLLEPYLGIMLGLHWDDIGITSDSVKPSEKSGQSSLDGPWSGC